MDAGVATDNRSIREVTLRVRHIGAPESDLSASYPDVTLRSVSSLTGTASERKRIVEFVGPAEDIVGFLEEFAAAEEVVDVEPLCSPTADRVFVGLTYDSREWDSIAQRITDLGVHYRVGTTISAGWEYWTLYLDEREDVSTVVEAIERGGNRAELVRDVGLEEVSGTTQLALTRILEELTARQQEVLAAAIDLGYYDHGRSASVETVAASLDVSPSTAWEHLVRAEGKIMDELGSHMASRGV